VKKTLTPKQRLFVHEYLVDLNATAAAKRAGYSKKTADVQGPRLLGNVRVRKAIEAARERRENKAIMTRDEILEELTLIGRGDLQNYLDVDQDTGGIRAKSFDELPAGASRALEMVREDRMIREDARGQDSIINSKVTFKMHSKLGALELLGKHQGLFPTRVEGNLTLNGKLSITDMKQSAKEVEDGSGD
jgi:phage terminase small subunit